MDEPTEGEDWYDQPTQPQPVVRRSQLPNANAAGSEPHAWNADGSPVTTVPPLPPARPQADKGAGSAGVRPEWPVERSRRAVRRSAFARLIEGARERQLGLGIGTMAVVLLLAVAIFAALTGSFNPFRGPLFAPRPPVQANPHAPATTLPTPTATPRPTATPITTPTDTPQPTATPADTPTPRPSPTPAPSPTPLPTTTPLPSPTALPTLAPTAAP